MGARGEGTSVQTFKLRVGVSLSGTHAARSAACPVTAVLLQPFKASRPFRACCMYHKGAMEAFGGDGDDGMETLHRSLRVSGATNSTAFIQSDRVEVLGTEYLP